MLAMKKEKHGGFRPGSGRKKIYGEETERIYFTVPVSKKEMIVKKVKSLLQQFVIKRTK